jgi:hypothetical protein
MGTAMLPVAFGTLLMVIWLGTPFYWGWIHLSLWGPVIWSVLVATVAVATKWRMAGRGLIASWIQGLCVSASGVFPIYFLGRFLSVLAN